MLVIWTLCPMNAQETTELETTLPEFKKNAIDLRAGLETGYFKDLNFSPLNYNSTGVAINFGYRRNFKNGSRLFVHLNPQVGAISSEYSEYLKSGHYTADLGIGYLAALPLKSSKFVVHAGGQYRTYLDLVFYNGTDAVTFFGLHGFDLLGNLTWKLSEEHRLHGSLALPVVGLLARPPYSGWDKYIVEHASNPLPVFFRGNWTSLNDYLAFKLNVQYAYTLGPKLDLVADYQFRYYRTGVVKTAIYPSSQITFGTRFKF